METDTEGDEGEEETFIDNDQNVPFVQSLYTSCVCPVSCILIFITEGLQFWGYTGKLQ